MSSVLSAAHFHSEEAAYAFVEARLWPNGPVCPHCGATEEHVGRLKGKTTRVGLYKCYACREPFTVKIGTVMESSHVPMRHWLQAIYLLCSSKKGLSTRQLQRNLGCGLKTAWFLSHRVREAMKDMRLDDTGPLGGAGKFVEADETYIGGKEKNKHRSRRTSAVGGKGKQIVFSLVERGGKVRSLHLPEVNAATLGPIMAAQLDRRSFLMTDEAGQYRIVGRGFAGHAAVNHGIEESVRGNAHTNTAENFFSILKRGITGCYFHVSQEHLHRYLAEFDFRYSNRSAVGVEDLERAEIALKGVKGKRLTYATPRRGGSASALT
jgi:transposase-like protein